MDLIPSLGTSIVGIYFLTSTFIILIAEVLLSCILAITIFRYRPLTIISEPEIAMVKDSQLPTITILIPLYKEKQTILYLLKAITDSDYPTNKLDIKLLVENNDSYTLEAISRIPLQVPNVTATEYSSDGKISRINVWKNIPVQVIHIDTGIKTKPNALNAGLSQALGEVVTVYDAEDRPEPSQLRKVGSYMANHPNVACVQARLLYYNGDQSLLTKFFYIEYLQHYLLVMAFHASVKNVILLYGTSNFCRIGALRRLNGWDPLNVTEDADLGIRLQKQRESIELIESITWEEAPPTLYHWIKQRIRWNKGYLYTLGVHFKRPRDLTTVFGIKSILYLLFTLIAPVISIIALVGWILLTIYWVDWFGIQIEPLATWIDITFRLNPALFYLSLGTFFFGVLYGIIMAFEAIFRQDDRASLKKAKYAILYPLYQMLQGITAIVAVVELFTSPSYWHKTYHGFSIESHSS